MDVPPLRLGCCFCGQGDAEVEFMTRWHEDGTEMWQLFAAHGACLTARMHPSMRGEDAGPLFTRFDGAQPPAH